ncbi:hypothetical protein OGAPHI_002263 [Ogataea philodendri]|uniref:Uncharacterized protein n=1 Tax=Ogataea philodendri TaxID=1378263 RepID=A0A9P8T7I8_9ASCO|nr:uncharacterized protein OGAPHI_002263 [Ogataea philodendri]KAH3668509.1 hypothetical protein OGAPHI_002263 [Ogataea philodendri]
MVVCSLKSTLSPSNCALMSRPSSELNIPKFSSNLGKNALFSLKCSFPFEKKVVDVSPCAVARYILETRTFPDLVEQRISAFSYPTINPGIFEEKSDNSLFDFGSNQPIHKCLETTLIE